MECENQHRENNAKHEKQWEKFYKIIPFLRLKRF
jgi:hypothetical protein